MHFSNREVAKLLCSGVISYYDAAGEFILDVAVCRGARVGSGRLAIFLLIIVPIGLPHPHLHHDARKQL